MNGSHIAKKATVEKVLVKTLPEEFYPFFWDVQPEKLDVQRNASFIIERLLEIGDDAAIRWVLASYPMETIEGVVRDSRRLSKKTVRFWQLIFGLEDEEIRCLSAYYREVESPLWDF